MTPRARLAAWLAALAPRERWLLTIAGGLAVGLAALAAAGAARDDLAMQRARIAAHERELGEVRRLAAILRREPPASAVGADAPSLLTRLEAAAEEVVGRERIASMTPAAAPAGDDPHGDRVALRVAGASLPEVVRLLHDLETGPPPLAVARLELRKHPDDPARFDTTVEVTAP